MKTPRAACAATLRHRLTACALSALVAAHGGCASSPPSRFYQLHPATRPAPQVEDASRPGSLIVGIGPVRVPDYLDRPQIVTQSGNEIDVADFDRWAGSIENDIARVLVEDLSALLPAERFFVTRWSGRQLTLSYRVEVLVERFDGPIQGPVSLRAQWFVFAPDRRLLLNKSSSISEKVTGGGGYGALVEAMSRTLEALSRVIAEDVTSLSRAAAAQ
jgi:uncharacterized lipoprotein YmbA